MIKIIFEADKNRSAAYDQEKFMGECTFSKSENIWILDHTFVDSSYGGQGIAGKLVAKVAEEARNAGVKIVPLCPFAKKEFDNKEEYKDLLSK